MDKKNKVTLQLNNTNQKLQQQFPNDPKGDIQITHKSNTYKLQKAHLRLQSKYFKAVSLRNINTIQIKEDFDEKVMYNLLSLFYGFSVDIQRSEFSHYIPVIQFLELDHLLGQVKKDIFLNIGMHDVFDIIGFASKTHDNQLFSFCLQELQKYKFQQVTYHQHGLLQLTQPLFKLVIKAHNQYKKKNKTQISYITINQLIQQYGRIKNFSNQKIHELKFQLFDLTALSSLQYREIFFQCHTQLNKTLNVNESLTLLNSQSRIGQSKYLSKSMRSESLQLKTYNQLKLQMIITFLKKKNEQLQKQNQFLTDQLKNVKLITSHNQDAHTQMQKDLKYLTDQLKRKQIINQEHRKIINKVQPLMHKLQRQIQKKTEQIDKLVEAYHKKSMERSKSKNQNKQAPTTTAATNSHFPKSSSEEDMIAQSQFLSADFIHQMFSGDASEVNKQNEPKYPVPKRMNKNQKVIPKPQAPPTSTSPIKKSRQKSKELQKIKQKQKEKEKVVPIELDDDQLQQLYNHRIQFDEEPCSVSKSQLPKLCVMVANDFNKKHLKLIYRRSQTRTSIGSKLDIKNRNSLLILINNQQGKHMGGFISTTIHQSKTTYIKDDNAFIFSLTQNKKFPIKADYSSDAVYLSDSYLISFSNDLMIANDCLTEKSNCFWPNSYAKDTQQQNDSVWLAGNSEFLIKDIQIYQVNDVEMEMVI